MGSEVWKGLITGLHQFVGFGTQPGRKRKRYRKNEEGLAGLLQKDFTFQVPVCEGVCNMISRSACGILPI